MSCSKIQKLLSLYLDDELDPSHCKIVQSHLEQCPVCRRHVDEMSKLSSAVKAFKPIQAPPRFEDIVMQRVMTMPQSLGPTLFERLFSNHQRRWTLALATPALALLFLGIVLPSLTQRQLSSPNDLVASHDVQDPVVLADTNHEEVSSNDQDTFFSTPVLIGDDNRANRLLSGAARGFHTGFPTTPNYRDELARVRSVRDELASSDRSFASNDFPVIFRSFQQEKQMICPSCYETLDVLTFFPSSRNQKQAFKIVASYR